MAYTEFLSNPTIMYSIIGIVALYIIYDKFIKPNKPDLKDEQLRAIAWDFGRQEIRKHTLSDLDSVSHLFLPFNKAIYRQGFDKEIKVGTGSRVQTILIPEDTPVKINSKGNVEKTVKELPNWKWDDKYLLIKYKTPLIDFLDFFPFSIIFTDILGSRHYMMIAESNILYATKGKLMLNVKEFTQMFNIVMPIDNIDLFLPKIKDLVQQGFNEELTGRLQKLPSDVAQLHLQHTQNLAIEEKRAEVTAKILEGQNRQARNF